MENLTSELLQRHPNMSFASIDSLDVLLWANESFKIAPSAYEGAVQKEKLSPSYLEKNVGKLEIQVIKAGHRLAHVISHIFDASTTPDEVQLAPVTPCLIEETKPLGFLQ